MAIYLFKCEVCGQEAEVMQKYEDAPPYCTPCSSGPGDKVYMHRQIARTSPPQFKGSGFYSTDYGGKSPK